MLAELACGYPDRLFRAIGHPVSWIGALTAALDRRLNDPEAGEGRRKAAGVLALIVVVLAAWAAGAVVVSLAAGVLGWIVVVLVAGTLLAQRSLAVHVAAVAQGLEEGGLPAGRAAVGRIVGRDVESLDARGGGAGGGGEPGGELRRRGGGAGVLDGGARAAGCRGLQGDQHRRQHDRASHGAASRLRLGGGAARRSRQPAGVAAGGGPARRGRLPRAGGVAGRGAGGGAPGRARASLAQRRLAGGGDGGGARLRAGRAAALRRGAGRGRGDGPRAAGAISARATSGGRCGSTGWPTPC